eukprot:Gb_34488 [translate_table: standard]
MGRWTSPVLSQCTHSARWPSTECSKPLETYGTYTVGKYRSTPTGLMNSQWEILLKKHRESLRLLQAMVEAQSKSLEKLAANQQKLRVLLDCPSNSSSNFTKIAVYEHSSSDTSSLNSTTHLHEFPTLNSSDDAENHKNKCRDKLHREATVGPPPKRPKQSSLNESQGPEQPRPQTVLPAAQCCGFEWHELMETMGFEHDLSQTAACAFSLKNFSDTDFIEHCSLWER